MHAESDTFNDPISLSSFHNLFRSLSVSLGTHVSKGQNTNLIFR